MSKGPYCGIGKIPVGKRPGSAEECAKGRQVRKWGKLKIGSANLKVAGGYFPEQPSKTTKVKKKTSVAKKQTVEPLLKDRSMISGLNKPDVDKKTISSLKPTGKKIKEPPKEILRKPKKTPLIYGRESQRNKLEKIEDAVSKFSKKGVFPALPRIPEKVEHKVEKIGQSPNSAALEKIEKGFMTSQELKERLGQLVGITGPQRKKALKAINDVETAKNMAKLSKKIDDLHAINEAIEQLLDIIVNIVNKGREKAKRSKKTISKVKVTAPKPQKPEKKTEVITRSDIPSNISQKGEFDNITNALYNIINTKQQEANDAEVSQHFNTLEAITKSKDFSLPDNEKLKLIKEIRDIDMDDLIITTEFWKLRDAGKLGNKGDAGKLGNKGDKGKKKYIGEVNKLVSRVENIKDKIESAYRDEKGEISSNNLPAMEDMVKAIGFNSDQATDVSDALLFLDLSKTEKEALSMAELREWKREVKEVIKILSE